jgi:SAM-dependent methyltransferase
MSSLKISDKTDTPTAEAATRERYAAAGQEFEACLCVPSEGYDPKLLEAIPDEVIQVDYGCGDPSKWVREGETVLDLGSGSGKACFIMSQKVGPTGSVIGVDFNKPMLDLSRRTQPEFAKNVGYDNVSFRKGRIQDLALDLDKLDGFLAKRPVDGSDAWLAAGDEASRLRKHEPMVGDSSVDVIVSNCVLNLVEQGQKDKLFEEMFRVLKKGGRCVISDIVSDEEVPGDMQDDPDLWSGCISGAFTEIGFLKAFEDAGFHGIRILERADKAWQTIRGIEFRSVTVEAYKGKQGPCMDRNQAVIYLGPWKRVIDDDGHTLTRGERMAVCDKTFKLYGREPYKGQFAYVEPLQEVPLDDATPFDCRRNATRDPRETKGRDYVETTMPDQSASACGPGGCC